MIWVVPAAALVVFVGALFLWAQSRPAEAAGSGFNLLNVSYDPTREFYVDYNKAFQAYWKAKTGETVTVTQSHGGSAKQARAVIDGLKADVVTLGIAEDIDAIAERTHAIEPNWASRLDNDSAPYTSTVVFLVRKGNPKGIHDWADLTKADVEVVTPNPKTSSGGRWNYLAAYGATYLASGKDAAKATAFIKELYHHVKVLDSGARGSTVTFVDRGQGDVLLAWEDEALLAVNKRAPGKFEIVYPSQSVMAKPPVSIVDRNAAAKGTTEVATAYLKYLYSPEGQEIAARNYYRPTDAAVLAKYAKQFPSLTRFDINQLLGSWKEIHAAHFKDGALFDQIYGR